MSQMIKLDKEGWFDTPVDHVEMEIPDYPEIVKEPMDLGTVQV